MRLREFPRMVAIGSTVVLLLGGCVGDGEETAVTARRAPGTADALVEMAYG